MVLVLCFKKNDFYYYFYKKKSSQYSFKNVSGCIRKKRKEKTNKNVISSFILFRSHCALP